MCRIVGCPRRSSSRSSLCRKHPALQRYQGHPEARPPRPGQLSTLRREAQRLLTIYGNRTATHEALRLAERVYTYTPSHNWTRFLRVQAEAERLRSRADPVEVLTRTLTAHIALQSPLFHFPDKLAESQYVGRVVLAPLWNTAPNGSRYLLTGRLVSDFGAHVEALLGLYCRGLLRKVHADEAARQASIERSLNFSEVAHGAQ